MEGGGGVHGGLC